MYGPVLWLQSDDVVRRLREVSPTTAAGYVVMQDGADEHRIVDRMHDASVSAGLYLGPPLG